MALTSLTGNLNIVSALDDEPNDVGGLSATELKAKFDVAANLIKTYINGTLIPELAADGVDSITRSADLSTIKYIRLGTDNTLQISADNAAWTTIASSGHIVYDKDGNAIAQRSRLKFINSVVSDDGTYTVVNGIKGDKGDTGATGAKGDKGDKGDTGAKGDVGSAWYPTVDGLGNITFALSETATPPPIYNIRGPQGPQGVQGLQGATGATGPQGIQGVPGAQGIQGPQGETGPTGATGATGPQGPMGPQGPIGAQGPMPDLINDLVTGGTTAALTAEQGKLLSTSISELDTLTANYSKRLSSIDPFAIFGASWDKAATPTLTRTDVTNVFTSNVGVDSNVVVNDFDKALIWGEMKQVTDSLGNTFIRIPKCYIKKTDTTNLKTWQVSKTKYKDFYLPACFWDFTNSKELDYVDVGAYNASSADGIKLDSKSGTYPLVNKNIVQMRTMAQANGAGYQQLDIHVVDLLQTLFIIEQGTIQSQSKVAGYTAGQFTATHLATATETAVNRIIVATATAALYEVGQAISVGTSQGGNQIFYGRTITGKTVIDASNTAIEFDGTAVNIATGNMLYNTGAKSGFSAGIAASVGSPVSNSSGKFPFVWHGIENLFGSIYQFVDGVNINERQAWVCPDAASYASNLFTAPYEQLNYVNGTADGYIKEMGYDPAHPYASFPTTVGGSSSTYYGDYYYQLTGQRGALLGGSWDYGAGAGLFCWRLGGSSSDVTLYVGGRLVRKPL